MLVTEEDLRSRLAPQGAAWLTAALATARPTPGSGPTPAGTPAGIPASGVPDGPAGAVPVWELRFAAAGRACGTPETAAAARVLLLHTARPPAATVARLYRHGSAAERLAVLRALPYLELTGQEGLPLVEDALRTNDTRLIAAALGPYAAAHLPAHAWRHAVLKCLFTGVPVTAVAALAQRAAGDGELARMLADFAAERTAAGRDVPDDLRHVLALCAAGRA
ncbi:EboA domain-containing protein [Actinacidiphila acidipaludis]|uniref:EboA domain-containing protein n=1 Tax=Actinacidiphila acidipaludis TaxID=2873382 RepID=A0ABS7QGV5_9ACTN|nr:EboA domain-containing protein [Streptomyces acidipaludis]MBY8882385.1 EboA domain-containing protein [Streptomyces acidipaludis]